MKMPSNNRVHVEGWNTVVAAIVLLAASPLAAAAVQVLEGDATIYCNVGAPFVELSCEPTPDSPIRDGKCCYGTYAKYPDSVTTQTSNATTGVTATISWIPSADTNTEIRVTLGSDPPCDCDYVDAAQGPSPLTVTLHGPVVKNTNVTLALGVPWSCNYNDRVLLNLVPRECRPVPISIVRNQSVHYVLTVES